MPFYEKEIDDVIDRGFFRPIAEKILPFFKKINFTASNITTISVIFSLLSLILYHCHHFLFSALFYLTYYILDCADGQFARKYKMTSYFGEVYDWNKDHIITLCFLLYFIFNLDFLSALIILLLTPIMTLHISILESVKSYNNFKTFNFIENKTFYFLEKKWYKYYKFSKVSCYKFYNVFFKGKKYDYIYNFLKYIKWLGTGTYTILFLMLLLGINKLFILTIIGLFVSLLIFLRIK